MGNPGGREEEDKKQGTDNEWAQLQDMPSFGGDRRRTPLPPLPDTEHPSHRASHSASQMGTKQVDEEALDWRTYVHPVDPGNSLAIRNVTPGAEPEAPNAHQDQFDPTMRAMYWRAYGEAAEHVNGMQQSIAPDYAAFMDGKNNPDLQALGFVIPAGAETGDAAVFADKQDVSGGTKLGSLFNKDGSLASTKKDQAGMETAHKAFEKHGTAKPAHDRTVSADHELKGALSAFDGAKSAVADASTKVKVAKLGIEQVRLSHLVEDDKEKVEKAKEHAEAVQKSIEFVVGGALKYMVAGPEEAVDALEGIGAMASFAVSKVSGHSIAAAEAVLAKHTEQLHDVEAEKARMKLEVAQIDLTGALHNLKSARETVLATLGKRKQVYEAAGHASARASGGDSGTQGKITAFMAAIPAAETLVGMVRNLATKCSDPGPRYSATAGSGFAMAVYDGSPQATNMVDALGNVAFLRSRFSQLLHQWEARLTSLQNARTQLGGKRAEVVDDDMKASIENNASPKHEAE